MPVSTMWKFSRRRGKMPLLECTIWLSAPMACTEVRTWRPSCAKWNSVHGRDAIWPSGCLRPTAEIHIQTIRHTNWRALPLETACFERYQTPGDYSKPVKIERRATATLSERARAYVDRVPLADEGTRNSNLSTAVFKMVEHFGKEATSDALPYLLAKSTLPEKEKRKTALRILHKPQGDKI